jgi:hypothetical protein
MNKATPLTPLVACCVVVVGPGRVSMCRITDILHNLTDPDGDLTVDNLNYSKWIEILNEDFDDDFDADNLIYDWDSYDLPLWVMGPRQWTAAIQHMHLNNKTCFEFRIN